MEQASLIRVAPAPVLSEALLKRFDTPGPRYTSYPTADRLSNAFGPADCERALLQLGRAASHSRMNR